MKILLPLIFLVLVCVSYVLYNEYASDEDKLLLKAWGHYYLFQYEKALDTADKIRKLSNAEKKDRLDSILRKCYTKLGDRHHHEANYEKAVNYYLAALQYGSDEEINEKIADTYNDWGLTFFRNKYYNKALQLFLNGMKYKSNEYLVSYISASYNNLGCFELEMEEEEKAAEYFSKALEYRYDELYKNNLSIAYYNWGVRLYNTSKYYPALEKFRQSYAVNDYPNALEMINKTKKRIEEERRRNERRLTVEWVEIEIDTEKLAKALFEAFQYVHPIGRKLKLVKRLYKASKYRR